MLHTSLKLFSHDDQSWVWGPWNKPCWFMQWSSICLFGTFLGHQIWELGQQLSHIKPLSDWLAFVSPRMQHVPFGDFFIFILAHSDCALALPIKATGFWKSLTWYICINQAIISSNYVQIWKIWFLFVHIRSRKKSEINFSKTKTFVILFQNSLSFLPQNAIKHYIIWDLIYYMTLCCKYLCIWREFEVEETLKLPCANIMSPVGAMAW